MEKVIDKCARQDDMGLLQDRSTGSTYRVVLSCDLGVFLQ
jgi:hypothetical protein